LIDCLLASKTLDEWTSLYNLYNTIFVLLPPTITIINLLSVLFVLLFFIFPLYVFAIMLKNKDFQSRFGWGNLRFGVCVCVCV